MPLNTPDNASVVIDRAVNDVRAALLPTSAKPELKNSWFGALIRAFSNRIFDFYFSLNDAALQIMPDTTTEFLERWSAIVGINRIAGARATGNVVAVGTLASVIPAGTVLSLESVDEPYTVRTASSITAKTGVAITSITRSGSVATVTTPVAHGLANNVKVTISGAVETEYNVTDAAITVTSATTFTYVVTGTPATPATGTIVMAFNSAVLIVDSENFTDDANLLFDAALTFESPIVGVDDVARADFGGVGGGSDVETDTALRDRFLDRLQNPVANFNEADITAQAKTIAGVTRVFVQKITPAVGQVTVYFMRDNDATPIPDGSEVTAVKNKLLEILPAHSDSADLIVAAPTEVSQAFTFTAVSPDTTSMKAAIEASLKQFFSEKTSVGVNVDQDAYRSAIFNTVDLTNGDTVISFTLSVPAGDITVAAGEIATLGNVTFP